MLPANTMMVTVAMVLWSATMRSQGVAEGANMIRQRTTRRVVETSPVVAAAAAVAHTPPTAREFGVVDTVEQETETEELEQYFRHLVPSSMASMPDAPTPSPTPEKLSQVWFNAKTTPLGDSEVTSMTSLFTPVWTAAQLADDAVPKDVVCFLGSAENLGDNIASVNGGGGRDCGAPNGCGVHVHAGTSCDTTETQGPHWYNTETLSEDPWAIIGYKVTTDVGYGQYAACVRTGYNVMDDPTLLEGHVFIIHGEDGGRVSCGVIESASNDFVYEQTTELQASLVPIPGTEFVGGGNVQVLTTDSVPDGVCYQGYAGLLPKNVVSFLVPDSGSDTCNVLNGCGTHIHTGTSCATVDEQGGHYYDTDTLKVDPWLLESYYTTSPEGAAALIGCTITGTNGLYDSPSSSGVDYERRVEGLPFIVHDTDGSRVLCGLIEGGDDFTH